MRKCIVMEYGWIIEGEVNGNRLEDASVVRKWMNGRGIGGLAKREHRHEYTLDPIGTVEVNPEKVLYSFEVER